MFEEYLLYLPFHSSQSSLLLEVLVFTVHPHTPHVIKEIAYDSVYGQELCTCIEYRFHDMHEFKTIKIRTSSVVKHLYYKQEGLASIPKVGNKSFTFTTLNTAYKEHLKKFWEYIFM
jgi:hypothetical protein